MDKKTEELIAIGTSVGAHCQPCLEYHLEAAKKLGISDEEIKQAIEIGHMVEKGAMSAMRKFSRSLSEKLGREIASQAKNLKIYDPAMCCSSGVCGSSVDPVIAEFAAVLNAIDKSGKAKVERYNLSQQPQAFVDNKIVKDLLAAGNSEILPLIFIDDELIFKSSYPGKEELLKALKLEDIEPAAEEAPSGCCGSSEGEGGCCG